jgi:hypothetical protein
MKLDHKIMAYQMGQYKHSKPLRDRYRATISELHALTVLYYIHLKTPNHGGIRSRLQVLIPQWNQDKVNYMLHGLKAKGLITWEAGKNRQDYTLEPTKTGNQIVEELYSIQAIDTLIEKY